MLREAALQVQKTLMRHILNLVVVAIKSGNGNVYWWC